MATVPLPESVTIGARTTRFESVVGVPTRTVPLLVRSPLRKQFPSTKKVDPEVMVTPARAV